MLFPQQEKVSTAAYRYTESEATHCLMTLCLLLSRTHPP
jgi:hypothetical protein